jgi:hypothetical protein
MREREQEVLRGLMKVLARMDLCDEEILYDAVLRVVPRLLISEMQIAIKEAQRRQWVEGVKGIWEQNKWSCTDVGRSAELKM